MPITKEHRADVRVLWDYQLMRQPLRRCSVGIGLGSHDIRVASHAAALFLAGWFDVLVFTGANSSTTTAVFPRGEAVHYAEEAVRCGVPASSIILEPRAANTGENIAYSRQVLAESGVPAESVLLVSKPYMERRAYATTRRLWPEVDVVCASEPLSYDEYAAAIGSERFVIEMIVGDFQRVVDYPRLGFAIAQQVPDVALAACGRLRAAGYTGRLPAIHR